MSIHVICPGCHKRYNVSDKFAGKSGPCPHCKTLIHVPTEAEEIKIHEPKQMGASVRGAMGGAWTKPLVRRESKLSPVAAVSMGGGAVVVVLLTWILGRAEAFAAGPVLPVIGLLLVSPPLVIAGYSFLHDEENLEPHHGKALYIRAGICSLVYIVLWGIYGYLAGLELIGELWTWLVAAPAFLVAGGLAALACLDLEFGPGFFHYSFYLVVTVFLRWLAGMGWVWEVSEKPWA